MVSAAPEIDGLFYEDSYGFANALGWYSLIRNNPLTSDCQVIKVGWYKMRKGVEHEFLRFDISSPDNQHTSIVIAERSGGGVRSPDSGSSARIPQFAASFSSSSKRYACDRVYFATRISAAGDRVEEMCDRPRLVCTLSFTGAKPTANELATLLYVTSAQEPKHNLHDTQCHWFAATVFDALNILYEGAEQDPTPHQAGTICGVPVDFKASGEEVCAKYRDARAALAEKIEQQRRLKQGQEEQRQREREQRQAAEEAAKRAEEQREAAEQERQKEREQREAAEERARAVEEANAKLLQELEALKRAVASTQQA
ncbi:hypothetical protein BKA82DRAFT_4047887 [Pisolithus tinctorius]|nr:hypothetical protein BKA82DRAFT_4047887 [Pisolithus tinctorius]